MKKILCLLMAILLLGAFVACDEGEEGINFADLSIQGARLTLDADATSALAALGEYRAFAETGSCYGDGKDRVYEYTSFKLKTYTNGDKEYILAVEIFNDADESVKTPEGVRIGSTGDNVKAAYGEASESSDSRIVYLRADGKVKLQFLLRDGAVTNIQYLKADAS
jgi:hypothetical protein